MAGHISRALAVFCVDEVIVFNDGHSHDSSARSSSSAYTDPSYNGHSDPNHFLTHLLSYLETPPHLRKHLFPMHPNLRTAGTLPSLDMPHHLRALEWCQYREGVTVPAPNPNPNAKKAAASDDGAVTAFVDVGFARPTILSTPIPLYTRVTVKFHAGEPPSDFRNAQLNGTAVPPALPREEAGYFWGYNVRAAKSLSAVLTESPFEGGYDVTVGTSERGVPLAELGEKEETAEMLRGFDHLLLVFGGVAGLEVAVKADEELAGMGVTGPDKLFDCWVDLCQGQGSRTIRTEEAVWLGLMGMRGFVSTRAEQS